MMSSMGAVNDNTVVVATCHDCQVLDLSEQLFGPHDLTVDYILTPTQVYPLELYIYIYYIYIAQNLKGNRRQIKNAI